LESLSEDLGGLDFGNESVLKFATGRLVANPVIRNSQIIKNAVLFRTADGKVWPGAVHRMPSGVWMGGSYHLGDTQPILERVVIPNTTVQDFRSVSNIDKRRVDFTFFEQSTFPTFNRIFRERVKDNLSLNQTSYFSDLLLGRGMLDQANMIFSFNIGKFIKENTKYPLLLEQKPALVSSHYLITSLRVVRKRVKKPIKFKKEIIGFEVNPDDLLDFDKNSVIKTIVDVAENTPGWISQQASQQTGNSIREVRTDREKLIRTFSVSDQQVARATDGYYQYGIEIEIHDRLNNYLNKQVSTLSEYREQLLEYFNNASRPTGRFADSSISKKNPHVLLTATNNSVSLERTDQKGNYDQRTNRFTQNFIEEMDRKYADNQAEKPWVRAVGKLSEVLGMFTSPETGRADLRGQGWSVDLWTMCSPKTGSPDGIATVIKLVDNVITQIRDLIGITTSPTTGTSAGATPVNDLDTDSRGAASAKPKNDVYKLQYWFTNSIFDANLLKRTGFHYLPNKSEDLGLAAQNGGFAGARTIRSPKFKSRIRNETLKYFTGENQPLGTSEFSVDAGLMTILAKTDVSDYTYLAPSFIQTDGTHGSFELFGDSISPVKLSATVSDILNIKSPPNDPHRSPIPRSAAEPNWGPEERSTRHSRIVRDNLTDVLADRGCTVELPIRAAAQTTQQAGLTVSQTGQIVMGSSGSPSLNLRGLPSVGGVLTSEDIREAAGASDSAVGSYLGTTQAITDQFSPETESTVASSAPKNEDALNSGLLFLRIMFNTILGNENLFRSSRILTSEEIRNRLSISNFDLSNPDNAIERFNLIASQIGGGLGRGSSYSFVSSLPNQIKSLFLSSNLGGQTVVKDTEIFNNPNILADPVNSLPVFLKYLNLSIIEVLTGYETVTQSVYTPVITTGASNQNGEVVNTREKTETQLKSPIWEPLTRENFQEFVGQRREMICRLRPYKNGPMKIAAVPGIQLSVYDGYFIIRPDNAEELKTNMPETTEVGNLVNLENAQRDYRGEYISTDPRVSIGGADTQGQIQETSSSPGTTANVKKENFGNY
jgi:hypothetical protein